MNSDPAVFTLSRIFQVLLWIMGLPIVLFGVCGVVGFYQDAHQKPADLVVLGLLIILGMQMLIGSGILYLLLQILTPKTPRPTKDEAKKNLMGE